MILRCSSLPLYATCPAAAQPTTLPFKSGGDAADLGSAVHDVVVKRIIGQRGPDDLADAADRYGVEIEELSRLVYLSWRRWEEMAEFFPSPKTVDLNDDPWRFVDKPAGVELTGHPDIYSLCGNEVRLLDLKTGRLDTSAEQQLRGYAFLAVHRFEVDAVYACALHSRQGIVEGWRWDTADLLQWWTELKKEIKFAAYNPGRQCCYCPRATVCPAHSRLVQFSIASLTEGIPSLPEDPQKRGRILAEVLDRAKLVESACQMAREAVRAEVAAAGGRLETDDGRELVLSQRTKTEIDFGLGEEILRQAVGDLSECVKVSKTEVEKAVKAKAPRGAKMQAAEKLIAQLGEAGALRETVYDVLDIKRKVEKDGRKQLAKKGD
ncbi:MAG: hypothetical protein KatS3mg105_3275 [Gemmatales bacterium]|nr:MAG: hypothetical protein KatS3mg105_3275 [Gemmatales bacterium]